MKASLATLVFLALVLAVPSDGQEAKPDYSKESLQRFVAEIPQEPERQRNVRFTVGGIEFGAIGTRWRFIYLPLMGLSGTRLTTTREWPDPFSLSGTAIATPRRAWHTQRRINAEMKRIEATERAKLRMKISGN